MRHRQTRTYLVCLKLGSATKRPSSRPRPLRSVFLAPPPPGTITFRPRASQRTPRAYKYIQPAPPSRVRSNPRRPVTPIAFIAMLARTASLLDAFRLVGVPSGSIDGGCGDGWTQGDARDE
jgi:hypothetical protein